MAAIVGSSIDTDVMEVLADYSTIGGVLEKDVSIKFDASIFSRHKLNKDREAAIEDEWAKKLESNPKLFNGSKFRFAGASEAKGSGTKSVEVQFGLSCYKEFVGLHLAEDASDLMQQGQTLYGDPMAFMGCPLGIGSVLSTSDERLIFIERSAHTGEAAGLIDTPGGHPEPARIPALAPLLAGYDDAIALEGAPLAAGVSSDPTPGASKDTEASTSPTASEETAGLIAHELFESMAEECVAEIGIPRETLGEVRLLGFTKNYTTACRVGAAFASECRHTQWPSANGVARG